MIQIIILVIILAVAAFVYLKNKQENRSIEHHNRLVEKQEALMKMLNEKNITEDEN
jgi:hypothetical protein